MRSPDHHCIQIVATAQLADEIERRMPGYQLVLLPQDAQVEGDLPAYCLMPMSTR